MFGTFPAGVRKAKPDQGISGLLHLFFAFINIFCHFQPRLLLRSQIDRLRVEQSFLLRLQLQNPVLLVHLLRKLPRQKPNALLRSLSTATSNLRMGTS